ncbi:hypothetical protein HY086_03675 [Candidatus Gottesmanbacteria bacterium]|nr:hypothetical protein [Candidatus Gottesmanbacteria bacterium]
MELQKTLVTAGVAFLILVSATYLSYQHTKSRTPQIILPGGVSYLGPSTTPAPRATATGKIPVPDTASWATWKGQRYPYAFSYPSSLSLGFFPNDPFDAVTIFWKDTNPQENLLLRVEQAKGPKRTYVENWWKQYNYAGIASVEEFTTTQGLKGYRAGFKDQTGNVAYEQVFLEVPGKPELIIWMSQKLLDKPIFDRIVDSLSWVK